MSPLQTCSSCWVRCHSKREGKNRLRASTGWPGVWGQHRCCVMSPVIAATVFVGEPGLCEAGVWWEAQQGCLLCRQGGDHQVWIPAVKKRHKFRSEIPENGSISVGPVYFHSHHCRQVGARSWRRCTVVAGSPGCSEAPCRDPPCPGVICFQGRGWNIWEADRLGRSVSMPPSRSAPPCNVGRPCRSWCRTGWRGPRPRCPGRCLKRKRRLRVMETQTDASCIAPALMSGPLMQQMFISIVVTEDARLQPWYRYLLL